MRTLQEKYNGIQEGKFSKEHFLAEARMQQPQLITRFNGYDDTVQILKNRGMIQEAKSIEEFSPYGSPAFSGEQEKQKEKASLSSLEVGDVIYVRGVSGDNLVVKDKKQDGTVGIGHPHNGKVSYQDGNKEVEVVKRSNLKEANLGHNEISSIHQEGGSWIVTYKKDGTKEKVFKTEKEARDFEKSLNEVTPAQEKYRVKPSTKPTQLTQDITAAKKMIDAGKSEKEVVAKYGQAAFNAVNAQNLGEAKLTKKSLTDYRYKPTNDMDKYPYEQILRGLRVELETLGVHGTPTAEEYSKALAKVSKNLAKDSIYYTNQVAGVNPKVDLHDKMIPVTAKNTVDTFNGMKKAELKEGFKKLIKKVLSEAKGDMFGDKERAARADKYGDYGSDIEYEFFSDPENSNEEDEQVDESKMGDVYQIAQESDTLRDFLIAVKKQHPETNLRRDIKELQHIWNNRGEVSENYYSNYGMDDDDEEEGGDNREGLNIFGRTQIDNNEINNVLEELGLYGEWDFKAGSWFLPEEEENYDTLEEMLEQEFATREINARIEGVFSDRNQIGDQDQEEDIYEGKQSLSELLK